jgi:hypothetical protein
MTMTEELVTMDRELSMKLMRHELQFQRLRAGLVEKYGEDGVQKVEINIGVRT